jgi:hypothetical protein
VRVSRRGGRGQRRLVVSEALLDSLRHDGGAGLHASNGSQFRQCHLRGGTVADGNGFFRPLLQTGRLLEAFRQRRQRAVVGIEFHAVRHRAGGGGEIPRRQALVRLQAQTLAGLLRLDGLLIEPGYPGAQRLPLGAGKANLARFQQARLFDHPAPTLLARRLLHPRQGILPGGKSLHIGAAAAAELLVHRVFALALGTEPRHARPAALAELHVGRIGHPAGRAGVV